MQATPRSARRTIQATILGALLLGLAGWAWVASQDRESTAGIASFADETDLAEASAPILDSQRSADMPERSVDLLVPGNSERQEVGEDGSTVSTVDILVRTAGEFTPIPNCELTYIDNTPAIQEKLEEFVGRNGFDIEGMRSFGRSTFTDEQGHSTVVCRSDRLSVIALSATHFGMEKYEIDSRAQSVSLDCGQVRFVSVQVVDTAGRPLNGVPIALLPKEPRRFLEMALGATTKAPNGLARLGPLEGRAEWVLHVNGTFPKSAGVDVDLRALFTEPIRIVMPDYGSIEVRLIPRNGKPFSGSAEVALRSTRDDDEFHGPPDEMIQPGTSSVRFERIGLGLELNAEVTFDGFSKRFEANGLGPRSAGERVVLEVGFDLTRPQLTGQFVDEQHAPLGNKRFRISGAVQVEDEWIKIDALPLSDVGGGFEFIIDAPGMTRTPVTLLILELEPIPTLGAVLETEVSAGEIELGRLVLTEPQLLAGGRLVDSDGVGLKNIDIKMREPGRGLGSARALECRTDTSGYFELRGWSSGASVRIVPNGFGVRGQKPVDVIKGSSGVRLEVKLPAALRR